MGLFFELVAACVFEMVVVMESRLMPTMLTTLNHSNIAVDCVDDDVHEAKKAEMVESKVVKAEEKEGERVFFDVFYGDGCDVTMMMMIEPQTVWVSDRRFSFFLKKKLNSVWKKRNCEWSKSGSPVHHVVSFDQTR